MAETNKLTTFVLDGTTLNIVDPTARSSATTATNNANTALSPARRRAAPYSCIRSGVKHFNDNDRYTLNFLMEA